MVIRFDATPVIGGGHAIRCLALAEEIASRGKSPILACNSETFSSFPIQPLFRAIKLNGDPTTELRQLQSELAEGCDVLLVDHFERSLEFERASRGWAKCVAAIDGQRRSHDCDLLIDPNPGRVVSEYSGLVPFACKILSGTEFAILRKEYLHLRPASLKRRSAPKRIDNLLVNFGAFSRPVLEEKVVAALEHAGFNGKLVFAGNPKIIVGQTAERNLPYEVERVGWTDSIAGLQSTCDLMIGAGGSSIWEGCCLGVPMILIQIAENQSYVLQEVGSRGAAIVLGKDNEVTCATLSNVFRTILRDPSTLTRLSVNAANLCDGLGIKRIGQAVDELLAVQYRPGD